MKNKISAALIIAAAALGAATFAAEIPKSSAPEIAMTDGKGTIGQGVPAFKVQSGYHIEAASANLPQCRFLQFDNFGTLYISAPKTGLISSFKLGADGQYTKVADVVKVDPKKITGLHNMEFVDGWLWYTTSHGIYKGKVVQDGSKLEEVTVVIPEGSVPGGGGHWWRPILVTPDGFYTGMGDHENFSDLNNKQTLAKQEETEPHAWERQKIWKYSLDGKTKTLFAAGNRNTEKLLFRPGTDEVWGCDHGSDEFGKLLGDVLAKNAPITDNLPGEEVNHYVQGGFYGHPFIADNNIIRPEFYNLDKEDPSDIVDHPVPAEYPDIKKMQQNAVAPAYLFPAHWANNGWCFLNKDSALGKKGDMYVTSHGSWDSDLKVGYCISHLEFDTSAAGGKPVKAIRVVDCLDNTDVARATKGGFTGRPCDIIEEPGTDNLIFSSDDPGNDRRIFRLSRTAGQ